MKAAYIAVIGDVRILAEQRKKVPRKRIVTAEYSADNDLDVYRLLAQLSVISKNNIGSIGELEGRISRLKKEYEKTQDAELRKKLLVFCDIKDTYYRISKGDYLSVLVEEERKRREQAKKKNKSR